MKMEFATGRPSTPGCEVQSSMSDRRRDLLFKIDILREQKVVIPKITDDMSDDRVELIYRDGVQAIKDQKQEEQSKEWARMASSLMPMFAEMLKPKLSSNEAKPDLVIHHIIKISKV